MIDKTLAILAGGKSSRMNYNNKALLTYKEKTFIENIIEHGKDFKEIIIIANNKAPYEEFGVRVFGDIHIGNGPLSGIHSALINSSTQNTLCIACDMPLTSREILNGIGNLEGCYDVIVPVVNKQLQPMCAIYSKKITDKLEKNIELGNNKLKSLIMNLNYKAIEGINNKIFEEKDFFNINTPNELKMLEEK